MLNHKQLSELTDYLTANGFAILSQEKNINLYSFMSEEGLIIVLGDSVRFHKRAGTQWCLHYEITKGISLFTLVHWMMLLHITGMVALKDFSITELKTEPGQLPEVFEDVFRMHAPHLALD